MCPDHTCRGIAIQWCRGLSHIHHTTKEVHAMDQGELEYEAFVDKFKPKKTTDDCYTPPMCMTRSCNG